MIKKEPLFPNYFADAETNFRDAEFVIFGVPYDGTSSFRKGSSKGPDSIRNASWNFEAYNLLTHIDFSDLPVHDYGNIEKIKNSGPSDMIKKVSAFVNKLIMQSKIPIAIGGEHSMTSGIIKILPPDTFILILDAHLDFRESYNNEPFNHACTMRRIADVIPIENILILGVRSAEKIEYKQSIKSNLTFFEASTINKEGIENIIHKIKEKINNKKVYLSIDIDVVDPGFAPGTGTPEPFGLNPKDICIIFDTFKDNIIGFDIVEVNPLFDHGETALLAAKYVRYGIEKISEKRTKCKN